MSIRIFAVLLAIAFVQASPAFAQVEKSFEIPKGNLLYGDLQKFLASRGREYQRVQTEKYGGMAFLLRASDREWSFTDKLGFVAVLERIGTGDGGNVFVAVDCGSDSAAKRRAEKIVDLTQSPCFAWRNFVIQSGRLTLRNLEEFMLRDKSVEPLMDILTIRGNMEKATGKAGFAYDAKGLGRFIFVAEGAKWTPEEHAANKAAIKAYEAAKSYDIREPLAFFAEPHWCHAAAVKEAAALAKAGQPAAAWRNFVLRSSQDNLDKVVKLLPK